MDTEKAAVQQDKYIQLADKLTQISALFTREGKTPKALTFKPYYSNEDEPILVDTDGYVWDIDKEKGSASRRVQGE